MLTSKWLSIISCCMWLQVQSSPTMTFMSLCRDRKKINVMFENKNVVNKKYRETPV